MKKVLFSLSIGALAFTGCTSESFLHEDQIQSNAIGFEYSMAKPSRASDAVTGDLTNDVFDEFYVYGYYTAANQASTAVQVFDGTKISRDLSVPNASWGYTNTRYWVPGAKYYFYAYSCGDIVLNNDYGTPSFPTMSTIANKVLSITEYFCDDKHNHDLIYAKNEGMIGYSPDDITHSNSPVDFKFQHILTKISAEFESDFDPSYEVMISNVRVLNIRNKGTYNPTLASSDQRDYMWESVDRDKKYYTSSADQITVTLPVSSDNNTTIKGSSTVKTGYKYVIPYHYTKGDVQLVFSMQVKDKRTGQIVLNRELTGTWSPNWKCGFFYTYKIRVTGTAANLSEIQFGNMNIDDWNNNTSSDTDPEINFSVNINTPSGN